MNLTLEEMGVTGLKHMGGLIYEEFLPQLTHERGLKIFREMESNDATVGAVLFAVEMMMRGVTWRVDPATDDLKGAEVASFVDSCRNDMSTSWTDQVADTLSFIPYGWSWHELVYKRRGGDVNDPTLRSKHSDGMIGWRKIPGRSQDSFDEWDLDETGGVNGLWQRPYPDFNRRYIPIEKSLLFRTTTRKGNPEGKSVFRTAWRAWYFKKRLEEVEGIGVERDLAGLPVFGLPLEYFQPNLDATQTAVKNACKDIVINVRRDAQEGVLMPLGYDDKNNKLFDLSLMSTGGARQFDTSAIINRYDQRIAMTVLADFILLGHEKVGSFALASSKTDLFAVAIGAWLDSIASIYNSYAIPRLIRVNDIHPDLAPTLVHGDIEIPDIKELGEYISKLSGAGAELFPDDALENHLRGVIKAPLKSVEED